MIPGRRLGCPSFQVVVVSSGNACAAPLAGPASYPASAHNLQSYCKQDRGWQVNKLLGVQRPLASVAGGRSPENLQTRRGFRAEGGEGGCILFPMARTARGTLVMGRLERQ